MTKILSNIIFTSIGFIFFCSTTIASEYTNLKQALKHPKDVTILRVDIHGVAKKYQNKIFPIGIGEMSNLERIEITTTTFTGFPAEISNCKKLKSIILMGEFQLPKELALLEIDSIRWSISKEKMSIFPKAIYAIKSLKYLDITHQNISKISKNLGQLVELEYLDLSNNNITKLPDGVGELIKLEQLYLQNNKISRLPLSLKNNDKLKVLNLNNNKLITLPAALFELPELFDFEYLNNPITPEILREIAENKPEVFHVFCSVDGEKNTNINQIIERASNIIMLSIYGKNNVESFIKNADKFYSLVYLEISGDVNFTYEIENLVKTIRLRKVVYKPLNGKIPAGFSKVNQIESFEADLGEFSKVMPLVILEMTQLKELNFSAYNLKSIPANISLLTELESLSITGNFKSIPKSIESLKKLSRVNITSEFITMSR